MNEGDPIRDPEHLHDHGDPLFYLAALEVALLGARDPCPHCRPIHVAMLPMQGTAWGLDVEHQPWCPIIADE